ncbi:hypothetical protein HK101_001554 [Irineochytrium annulatum]|nr:hypothetical protein HK101_001554 [Irineochytrium annulatum]
MESFPAASQHSIDSAVRISFTAVDVDDANDELREAVDDGDAGPMGSPAGGSGVGEPAEVIMECPLYSEPSHIHMSTYNLTLGGVQFDDKGCPLYPPGYVDPVNPYGWSTPAAFVGAGISILYLLTFVRALMKCYGPSSTAGHSVVRTPRRARLIRRVFGHMALYALVRTVGFFLKGTSVVQGAGSNLAVPALVFQSLGFLPLIHVILAVLEDWIDSRVGKLEGPLGAIYPRLSLLTTCTFVTAGAGAIMASSSGLCRPSDTAKLVRDTGLWLVALISWLSTCLAIRLAITQDRHPSITVCVIQSLLMVARTSYGLVHSLQGGLAGEADLYLCGMLPEWLFCLPLLCGYQWVSMRYFSEDKEDAGVIGVRASEEGGVVVGLGTTLEYVYTPDPYGAMCPHPDQIALQQSAAPHRYPPEAHVRESDSMKKATPTFAVTPCD